MPTHEEEIRTRFSFDTSILGRAKRELSDFYKEGESGFVHMGSQGRAFHKVMEKITEASPIMGNALRTVLNPTIGAFALLAAGIGIAHSALEKFNSKWDQMRNDAAKPIGTPGETLFGLIDQSRKTVAGQKEKLEPFAAKATQGLQSRDRKTIDEDIKTTQDRINGLLKHQTELKTEQQTVDHIKEEIKKLEEKRGELNETATEDEELKSATSNRRALASSLFSATALGRTDFGQRLFDKIPDEAFSIGGIKRAMSGKSIGEAEGDLNRLTELRAQLAGAQNSKFGKGGAADEAETAKDLAEQQARLAGLQVEQERAPAARLDLRFAPFRRGQIPNPASGPGLGISFPMTPLQRFMHPFRAAPFRNRPALTIDPITGGYTAQGIADQGGVAYKPIQGAPGFVAPPVTVTDTRTNQQRVDDILSTLLSHLKSGGIPVKGSE